MFVKVGPGFRITGTRSYYLECNNLNIFLNMTTMIRRVGEKVLAFRPYITYYRQDI